MNQVETGLPENQYPFGFLMEDVDLFRGEYKVVSWTDYRLRGFKESPHRSRQSGAELPEVSSHAQYLIGTGERWSEGHGGQWDPLALPLQA